MIKIKRFYLEITNACNLNCPFCENDKGHSFMNIDTIKDYLKQIKEYSNYVYLHVLGEPLLHPDIEEIFEYADNLNLDIQLVTNGTLLKDNLNLLKHKSLRKLSISIHSINNIEACNDYFDTINSIIENNKDKYIELRFYDLDNLDATIKDYLKKLYSIYQIQNTSKNSSYKLKDNVYLYFQDMFKWPSIDDQIISSNGKCHGAIDQLAILNDGRVTICCLDPKGYNTIGNLNESKLKEILNSKQYKKIIDDFRNSKLTFDLCQKCTYRLRFK